MYILTNLRSKKLANQQKKDLLTMIHKLENKRKDIYLNIQMNKIRNYNLEEKSGQQRVNNYS